MQTAAGLVKLKPESAERVENWRRAIAARRTEALATLADEGVEIESWFQVEIAGEPYLLWYLRAESIERVWQVARRSRHDIDRYHFQTMAEIAETQIDAMPLLDLEAGEGPTSTD